MVELKLGSIHPQINMVPNVKQMKFDRTIELLNDEVNELKQANLKLQEQIEFAKKESETAKQDAIKADTCAKVANIQAIVANIIAVISAIAAIIALFK